MFCIGFMVSSFGFSVQGLVFRFLWLRFEALGVIVDCSVFSHSGSTVYGLECSDQGSCFRYHG